MLCIYPSQPLVLMNWLFHTWVRLDIAQSLYNYQSFHFQYKFCAGFRSKSVDVNAEVRWDRGGDSCSLSETIQHFSRISKPKEGLHEASWHHSAYWHAWHEQHQGTRLIVLLWSCVKCPYTYCFVTSIFTNSVLLDSHEQVVYTVLRVLNLITDDNIELLESACRAGMVSLIIDFGQFLVRIHARNQMYYYVV